MATLTQLTPTQSTLIRAAAKRPHGEIKFPDTLRGGARAKTLKSGYLVPWLPAAQQAGTPRGLEISGKKKGSEIIRALQYGGAGGI